MYNILANKAVGICELKANPTAILTAALAGPVGIFKRNKPAEYIISPEVWEAFADILEDTESTTVVNKWQNDGEQPVKISLSER